MANENNKLIVFEDKKIRRVLYDGVVSYPYQENVANGTEITITYEIDKTMYNNECPL